MNEFIDRVMIRLRAFEEDGEDIEIKNKTLRVILEQEYDNHDIEGEKSA